MTFAGNLRVLLISNLECLKRGVWCFEVLRFLEGFHLIKMARKMEEFEPKENSKRADGPLPGSENVGFWTSSPSLGDPQPCQLQKQWPKM